MNNFIPRDTPIFCICDDTNEFEKIKFKETRDSWVHRFGFTNFRMQKKLNRSSLSIESFKRKFEINFSQAFYDEVNSDNVSSVMDMLYFHLEFIRLARKLRKYKTHSIIIQYNTVLTKDIPISFLDNEVNAFKLDFSKGMKSLMDGYVRVNGPVSNLDMESGMLASPKFYASVLKDIGGHTIPIVYPNFDLNNLLKKTYLNKKHNFLYLSNYGHLQELEHVNNEYVKLI